MNGGRILIIGYGNEVRGDDGVGLRVAEALEALTLPGVDVVAAHQLTPDLAAPIAEASMVVFADALPSAEDAAVEVFEIRPEPKSGFSLHTGGPSALLALARSVYGRAPKAWCVAIPAVKFDFGFTLTQTARRGVEEAVASIRRLVVEGNRFGEPGR
jgi:hydrogenase maturation protease